jgi:flagellar biogenesis protein FliO
MNHIQIVPLSTVDQTRSFGGAVMSVLRSLFGQGSSIFGWLRAQRIMPTNSRQLRLVERVSLGDKNFVAILQINGRQVLIGVGSTGISLLSTLDATSHNEVPDHGDLVVQRRAPRTKPTKGGCA